MLNKGKKASSKPIVKQQTKAIIVSVILATIGVASAVYLYQYTNTAKLEQKYNQVQVELEKTNSQLDSTVQDKTQLEQQVQELNKVKQELESQLQAKRQRDATLAVLAKQNAQASPTKPTAQITGTKTDWMRQAGIPESQWQYVDYIVSRESGWNPNAVNKSSGATGLCQSLPASKMASAGSDYMTNPVTQLKWCNSYAVSRYGGWSQAYSFWIAKHWW